MTKTAMITICGRPNVGKSTLTNALVGEKIAIVSPKPQTTRSRITAIVSHGDTQFVLLDTPGFHKPRTRLGDYMVNVVRESVADVDCVLLLVEPIPSVGPQEEALIERLRQAQVPALLVINKIDTVDKAGLLAVMAVYAAAFDFDAILPVSAKTGDGLDELLAEMEKYAAEGPHLFPDDMITDQPERQICAELVREKLLRCLDREIPHGTAVEVTKFSERENGSRSSAKRRATRASSSAKRAPCSKRSGSSRGTISRTFWARRSICRPGSRSGRTGATRWPRSETSAIRIRANNSQHVRPLSVNTKDRGDAHEHGRDLEGISTFRRPSGLSAVQGITGTGAGRAVPRGLNRERT